MKNAPSHAFVTPRPVANLVLIEAPGKLKVLTRVLKRLKLPDFHILATQGHIMDYPAGLQQLGLDKDLNEVGRSVVKSDIVRTISAWSAQSQCVLIASDADQEGDVIAQDLIDHALHGHPRVLRVALKSLQESEIQKAFTQAFAPQKTSSWPGAARRIADRLIGFAFSGKKQGATHGLSVGRVQTAILGALAFHQLPKGVCHFVHPSNLASQPLLASVGVTLANEGRLQDLVSQNREWLKNGHTVDLIDPPIPGQPLESSVLVKPLEPLKPWTYCEGVIATARATGRSVEEVAASMQRLYEDGKITYPRSVNAAMSPSAIAATQKLAQRNGVRIDTDRYAVHHDQSRHAHEAVSVISSDVDLSARLSQLGPDEQVLLCLARHLITCGQPHVLIQPNKNGLSPWAQEAGVQFKAVQSIWPRNWKEPTVVPSIESIPADQIVLGLMLSQGLGRPSTQIGHCMKFISRGLMDENMQMTEKAKQWLASSPPELLKSEFSRRLEDAVGACGINLENNESPQELAIRLLQENQLWDSVWTAIKDEVEAKNERSNVRIGF